MLFKRWVTVKIGFRRRKFQGYKPYIYTLDIMVITITSMPLSGGGGFSGGGGGGGGGAGAL